MGDVLSQNEIDNLLSALNSGEFDPDEAGETDDRQIKDYDFARPSKFSKEHLRTLEFIFEHYARLLSTNLPVYLRKNVQVEVMHSEAVTYQEFSNSLSNPVILGVVNFAPLDGNIIMEVSTEIGFAIVDRMLGGGGKPLEKNREFTEIELTIIERITIYSFQKCNALFWQFSYNILCKNSLIGFHHRDHICDHIKCFKLFVCTEFPKVI